jgi:hypothetical protein
MRLLTGLLVIGASVAIAVAHDRASTPASDTLELVSSRGGAFRLRAESVTGLYPGSSRTLAVRASNPYAFAIEVVSLKGTIAAKTSKAGCAGGATNLSVRPYSGRGVVIRPGAIATVGLRLRMPLSVANACQGATFTIRLSGGAIRR